MPQQHTLESPPLLGRGPLKWEPSRGGHQPRGGTRRDSPGKGRRGGKPGPECLRGRERTGGPGHLREGVPTRSRQERLTRCVCWGNPGPPRASSPGPRSAVLPTPTTGPLSLPSTPGQGSENARERHLSEVSRAQENHRPRVSRGEGSPAEAEPTSGPRLTTGPAQRLGGPQGGGGARVDSRGGSCPVAQQV